MYEIAPSILNAPPLDLGGTLKALDGADWIHLDMMDGHFVPNLTFGPWLAPSVVDSAKVPVEAHLMVTNPEDHLMALAKAGVRRVFVHAEATAHLHRLANAARSLGLLAGVALNPATPVSLVETVLADVDALLVMSVDPGWGGQTFWPGALPKIRRLREMGFGGAVEVDGGLDPTTAPDVVAAGADVLVVGSFLFAGISPQKQMAALRAALT